MEENYLKSIGSLALATRLKNLSDRLARDVTQIYKESSFEFEPRWFTFFYALKGGEELSVTQLAALLNQTHPAVNQVANALVEKGLIEERKAENDNRKRLMKLSKKGIKLIVQLEPLWAKIKEANDQLLDETDIDLLSSLTTIEEALDKQSMHDRINS